MQTTQAQNNAFNIFFHASMFVASLLIPVMWVAVTMSFDIPIGDVESVCGVHLVVVALTMLSAYTIVLAGVFDRFARVARVLSLMISTAAMVLFLAAIYLDVRLGMDIARDIASYDAA
jgi:hypothetical protein